MDSYKILAVIPARGGSKAIERKNIKPFLNRPLIEYTFDAAKKSRYIDRIVLSTDDRHIADIGLKNGIEVPFMRPAELAQDKSPTLPVIQHAVHFLEEHDDYKPDYILILQPTSPLRTATHIDEALDILIDSAADSVVSVMEVPHQFNPMSLMVLDKNRLKHYCSEHERYTSRQEKPLFYARNGAAVYAFTYETLMINNSLYGNDCRPYVMKKEYSIDIDDPIDFEIAQFLLARMQSAYDGNSL